MAKRYIDAVEAEARIKELFPDIPKIDFMDTVRNWREKNKQFLQCLGVIRSLPTADMVERKKGKWINDRGLYKCSCCNKLWNVWWAGVVPIEQMKKVMPYCPMCGSYNGEESDNES